MKVEVNRERCKECGLCIHHCPKDAIRKSDHLNATAIIPYRSTMRNASPAGSAIPPAPTAYFMY